MIRNLITTTASFVAILLLTACFRSETGEVTVQVPQMESELDARIVTNAALDEVVGSLTGIQYDVEVDLQNHQLIYHEGGRLLDPRYRDGLISSLQAVGLEAHIVQARFNPIQPLRLPNDEILNYWPTRCSALIAIPGMDTTTKANIAIDALAYVRNGGDDPRVITDRENREIRAVYNNVALSEKNLEEAIACIGYQANTCPPKDRPHGWSRFKFR